ncbi:MAG: cytochrome c biogenesis protein CcdA [Alphaproteobacteria bacterium]|nr:cytochrome c biogenesis protein CcdA [Alphaproteobacteria bacterium]
MIGLALSLVAGALSTLFPCVLPILPIVVAAALDRHPLGPLALTAGLAASFAAMGVILATVGLAIGLDVDTVRNAGAVLMLGLGTILLSGALQMRFAAATAGFTQPLNTVAARFEAGGLAGQVGIGALLGLVWAPCTGPLLGAALTFASRGESAGYAALVMVLFAIGAVLPLLALAYLARSAMPQLKARLAAVGRHGKTVLGGVLLGFGLLVLSGLDKRLEAAALDILPAAWVSLMTRF